MSSAAIHRSRLLLGRKANWMYRRLFAQQYGIRDATGVDLPFEHDLYDPQPSV